MILDGRVVCATTPCRVFVPRGTPRRIIVRKAGYLPGTVALDPAASAEPAALVLRRRESPLPGHRMQGGLLLPDAFGKR